MEYQTILDALKKSREKAGFTQAQMAMKLGIDHSTYCNYENGRRGLSLKTALDIAAILKKTPNSLFLPSSMTKRKVDPNQKAGVV